MEPVNPDKKFGDRGLSLWVIGGVVIMLLIGAYFGYRYLKHLGECQ
ncbi:DotU family type IV/VI secretion system protein [Thermococcus paralvinellae]|nr:DotU family type IV/VI secretion system protein [Thermococcus paralvinellae]